MIVRQNGPGERARLVAFRNKRGIRGHNTAADMVGTRYNVHRLSDDRYVGQVEKIDGLWLMRFFNGIMTINMLDRHGRPLIGSNREGCGNTVLRAYEGKKC